MYGNSIFCLIIFKVVITLITAKSFMKSDFNMLDKQLGALNAATAELAWEALIGREDAAYALKEDQLSSLRNRWLRRNCKNLWATPSGLEFEDRALWLLCRGPRYEDHEAREMLEITSALSLIYNQAEVCLDHGSCYRIEPDLEKLFAESRDPNILKEAWVQLRTTVGFRSRPLYVKLVEIMNSAAKRSGYSDIGSSWREEYEVDGLEKKVTELFEKIQPLYRALHAFVRFRLQQYYGDSVISSSKMIPAHLLGNVWAQNWEQISDVIFKNSTKCDYDCLLRDKYSLLNLIEKSDEFYASLGFTAMPANFWNKSSWENAGICHGTAINMFRPNDVRMSACGRVTMNDFKMIVHEMGHLHYYLQYQEQPFLFQNGASSAMHECVGDAISFAFFSLPNMRRLGLLDINDSENEENTEYLLRVGLRIIPQIPFALALEKWRWSVFKGEVSADMYNAAWWQLVEFYQGVAPPTARSEMDFDPAAKYHINSNIPYIRKMMKMGSKLSFKSAMELVSGSALDADSFLKFFKPLKNWLDRQIKLNEIKIGWHL